MGRLHSFLGRARQACCATYGGRRALREKRVLDVGCAYGGFVVAASQAGAREVIGIDISRELLDLASMQLQDYGVDAELVQADIFAMTPSDLDHRHGLLQRRCRACRGSGGVGSQPFTSIGP
ncbi:MAG: class I SAM-dependent methyltransferase [Acidimicrobiia bacterium]